MRNLKLVKRGDPIVKRDYCVYYVYDMDQVNPDKPKKVFEDPKQQEIFEKSYNSMGKAIHGKYYEFKPVAVLTVYKNEETTIEFDGDIQYPFSVIKNIMVRANRAKRRIKWGLQEVLNG